MKKKYILLLLLVFGVTFTHAQTFSSCPVNVLYDNLQGVWKNLDEPGTAFVIVDSNAYLLYKSDYLFPQDSVGEIFSIVCNNKGESFFIWWQDLSVQEFILEGDTLLLLDYKGRADWYIRVRQFKNEYRCCFCFINKFQELVVPNQVVVFDNLGNIFELDSSACFWGPWGVDYSFSLQVIDKKYLFYERQFDASNCSIIDTIQLENLEQSQTLVIKSTKPVLNHRLKKQIAVFFQKSHYGIHRLVVRVGIPLRCAKEIEHSIQDIVELYKKDLMSKNNGMTTNFEVYYYYLPENSKEIVFEIEAFDYQ